MKDLGGDGSCWRCSERGIVVTTIVLPTYKANVKYSGCKAHVLKLEELYNHGLSA